MASETLDTPTTTTTTTTTEQPPSPPPLPTTDQGEKRKQPEPTNPLHKTSLCSYFRSTGNPCTHGDTCRYAHGEQELRMRPDNTWDPTSDKAKKMKVENGVHEVGDEKVEVREEVECDENGLEKCLLNVPMKWSGDQFKGFLDDEGIQYKSAKTRKGMLVGFITFETVEQVKIAIEKLQGKPLRNKNLKLVDANPRSYDRNKKPTDSANKGEEGGAVNDGSTPGSSEVKARSARDAVTPLAHLSYPDQLEQKTKSISQILKKLARNARKACPDGVPLPDWINNSRDIGGLACKLEGIIESPLVNGYRNKCEFSIGYSLQGKPTVGFLLGNFREGVTAVEEPSDCPNVSKISVKYAEIFQNFLQTSTYPIWNRMNNTGFWRQLTVREGRAQGKILEAECSEANIAEVLLMVQISSADFESEAVKLELEKMAEAFVVGASASSPPLPLTVLAVQDHQGVSNVAPADAPLRILPLVKSESSSVEESKVVSEARIQDYINNLRFYLSPTAFFQVNTLAAEKLYSLAGDWANLGPNTLLFDVCCGTGTIGLTLAHRVGMVVGIEMNASAVADAKRNAEINGIANCRFVCSKAEDVMGSLLKEYVTKKQDESNDADGGNKEEKSASEDKLLEANNEKDEAEGMKEEEIKEPIKQEESNFITENISSKLHQFDNVVAIVDPPRVGLHPTVIKALRTHSGLKRLVYISCNPESLMANAIELCTPSTDKNEKGNNKNRGWRNMSNASLARQRAKSMPNSEPFQPIKAMAVDLFPHTPHCEVVMLLER